MLATYRYSVSCHLHVMPTWNALPACIHVHVGYVYYVVHMAAPAQLSLCEYKSQLTCVCQLPGIYGLLINVFNNTDAAMLLSPGTMYQ